MTADNSGKTAERLVRAFLFLKGYRILASNYITGRRTTAGEIDIIACKGKTLVFVEVKKRSTIEKAAYALLAKQRQRIQRGAEAFIKRHPQYKKHNVRFDAVLVKLPLTIKHIKNAF
ncbi:MAG: YraN family protein [Lactobacillus sp.]|jgi:putative endonuclease|nr:YraN family protein [Lactobacillus sp.]